MKLQALLDDAGLSGAAVLVGENDGLTLKSPWIYTQHYSGCVLKWTNCKPNLDLSNPKTMIYYRPGLHTCGDLSADSCRLFLATPERLAGLVLFFTPLLLHFYSTLVHFYSACTLFHSNFTLLSLISPFNYQVLCGCCYGRLTEPVSFPISRLGEVAVLQLGFTLRDLVSSLTYDSLLENGVFVLW